MEFLDSNLFKAFFHAAEELNFTKAAKKASMTQSGISQHIAKLESMVGAPLFERINKQVHLTDSGRALLKYIEKQHDDLELLKEVIHNETSELSGKVRYAMPESCLFTPHFSMLLKKTTKSPELKVNVDICPNDNVVKKLLNNEIDFGFVTKESTNPAITHQKFATEEYILVSSSKLVPENLNAKNIKELPFIKYPGMSVLFNIWKSTVFPKSKKLSAESLNYVGSINNLQGVVTMLLNHAGYTLMPSHCAEPWLSRGKLVSHNLDNKKVTAGIYIMTLKDLRLSKRVEQTIKFFEEMKKE